MAVMGYCKLCERLVFIKPGEQKPASREHWWYPVEHDDSDGKRCDGMRRGI